jgi:hypothetical protein
MTTFSAIRLPIKVSTDHNNSIMSIPWSLNKLKQLFKLYICGTLFLTGQRISTCYQPSSLQQTQLHIIWSFHITRRSQVFSGDQPCKSRSAYRTHQGMLLFIHQGLKQWVPWLHTVHKPKVHPKCSVSWSSSIPRNFFSGVRGVYARNFFRWGFNKFSWAQRAERTGIWGVVAP